MEASEGGVSGFGGDGGQGATPEVLAELMKGIIERDTAIGIPPVPPDMACTTKMTIATEAGLFNVIGVHFLVTCDCRERGIEDGEEHDPVVLSYSLVPEDAYELALALFQQARELGVTPPYAG